jgi:DNA-binding NarL/FixJ family response regulator
VHPCGLLTLAIELFEAVWDRAVPVPLERPDEADEPAGDRLGVADRQVLGLLLAGNTDVSVARQLDRSLRWVQRRVRLMMDAAGVRTRLQLGWEARQRGWLD